jgi:signal transduction histidine kinase
MYLNQDKKKKRIDDIKKDLVSEGFKQIQDYFKDDKRASALVSQLKKKYLNERAYYEARVKTTESLAAVGLSVEVSSHDIMLMYSKGMDLLGTLRQDCEKAHFDIKKLPETLERLYGIFSYVKEKIKDLQLLFVSSKQTKHQIRVDDILSKVVRIYKNVYDRDNIDVEVCKEGSPLMASCTDSDILQVLINLFDNSLYWLNTVDEQNRFVLITLNGDTGQLVFSDNGPGIREDDEPYIFEPFFSGKGQTGRGLGLYISRKIMERNDYSIELIKDEDDKKLKGANFVISFVKQDKD